MVRIPIHCAKCLTIAAWLLALFSAVLMSASAASDDMAGVAFFERKIRPVLVKGCYQCHSQGATVQGGLRLDLPATILQGGDSGPAIVAGEPTKSLLVKAIGYASDIQMPPEGKLPTNEIALLSEWVSRGMPLPSGIHGRLQRQASISRSAGSSGLFGGRAVRGAARCRTGELAGKGDRLLHPGGARLESA